MSNVVIADFVMGALPVSNSGIGDVVRIVLLVSDAAIADFVKAVLPDSRPASALSSHVAPMTAFDRLNDDKDVDTRRIRATTRGRTLLVDMAYARRTSQEPMYLACTPGSRLCHGYI